MSYLDWSTLEQLSFSPEPEAGSSPKTRLSLELNRAQIEDLLSELEGLYFKQEPEMRLVLPQSWVIFWKAREEGCRLMLAHPDRESWVGTVSLDPQWAKNWLDLLRNLAVGEQAILSHNEMVCNLELAVRCRP